MRSIDFGEKFLYFQDRYRKPDGRKFKLKDIERATGGYVTGAYITQLKQGRYENPGYDKLRAIAEVMGFPPELWYQPQAQLDNVGATLPEKLDFLIGTQPELENGDNSAEEEISRLSFGKISAERLYAARNGELDQLEASEYFALSGLFGVDISFWYQSEPALDNLDSETIVSLRDQEAQGVLNKFHQIEREEDRTFIRELIDRFTRRENGGNDQSNEPG